MYFDVYLINVSTDDIQLSRFNYITISVLQNSFEDLIKSFNKDCLYRYIMTINNDVIIPDDDWLRQLVVRMYDNGWQLEIVETTKMPKIQEDIQVGIEDKNIATIYSYVFLCNDILKIGLE
jgi:molybdenum cofactor biosynthesis enzyme MoaA